MFKKISEGAVSSIADIRRLLQIDSVDDEDESSRVPFNDTKNLTKSSYTHLRVIRSLSLDAEPAAIAECKTRVEVFEISRKLVDSSNANFLVWPPCVEVQRCSGCCNTKIMRCSPARIHVRHVQVNKILILGQKNKYVKVTVPLEDHVECKCEPITPLTVHSHQVQHQAKGAVGLPARTLAPVPTTHKEVPPLRPFKRKHRKYKHLPDKKEQRELLVT
ncbi:hypothetical protein GDO86_007451 [Hymenochirus boettgeri]|uniref:Platelet-derived growth factor subunit B n=1 Tax=Hymenochirus boettgeri TaxID=247094 RepID=A0A8T2J1W2_9PIPI|nr:hypothetical protein GDO86_007451 [Hymenochirus boettgeri]